MGKSEDEQPLPSATPDAQGTNPSTGSCNECCLSCSRIKNLLNLRCVWVLLLGVAVLLSAVFWLPFFHFGDKKDLDLDYGGHDIVASFMLNKPTSFLEDYVLQLQGNIFDEMRFSTTKVEIISLDSSSEPNTTKVVFSVESDITVQSLIRASFVSLVTLQSSLRLDESLFGDPFAFEVLKFRGGITAIPDQKAFLMQSVQILFNFTLNFSIDQILSNFDELSSQLKTGLHLAPYENLYIKLTNLKGSTVDPPTTVESQVLLAVGINLSNLRLKQLAQTIGSHSKNLGLNNTVFGRVKQVRLSSILQHSLGAPGSSPSPSPSPAPESHHHHRPHYHRQGAAPVISPSPATGTSAPAPGKKSRFTWKHGKNSHGTPSATPVYPPLAAPSRPREKHHLTPEISPVPSGAHAHARSPSKCDKNPRVITPSVPPVHAPLAAPSQKDHKISPVHAPSPPPNVAYGYSKPPSRGEFYARAPDVMPIVSPLPSPSSSASIFSSKIWVLPLFLLPVFHF